MKRPNIALIKRVRMSIRSQQHIFNDFQRRLRNRVRVDRTMMRGTPRRINRRIDAAYMSAHPEVVSDDYD